ncbi:MAG TPA: hypothetical protein VGK28_13345, partial [Candidatus Dormibacteraeota bacterium]
MSHVFRRTSILSALVLLALVLGMSTVAASSDRSAVHGTVPPWAKASNYAGAANGNNQIGFRIYLGWNNQANLASFINAVSDPRSS